MAALASIPVFMRVGDLPEYEIGSICPEAVTESGPDGTVQVVVRVPSMAEFCRAVADAFEKAERPAKPPA